MPVNLCISTAESLNAEPATPTPVGLHVPNSWQASDSSRCQLLSGHGGAGVTTLLRAGVRAVDADGVWPKSGIVVVVVRSSASGLEAAQHLARESLLPAYDGIYLAGLAVVADAPGRLPSRLTDFLDLISGAYPRVWEIPWAEEWRLAGRNDPLPVPPAVRHLDQDLHALAMNIPAQPQE